MTLIDAPLNFLGDPKVGPRVKQRKNKIIGAHSLIRSTSRVGGHARTSGWD